MEYGLVDGGGDQRGEKGVRYHFRVTWPLCTRFMLNPTVGMELDVKLESLGAYLDT